MSQTSERPSTPATTPSPDMAHVDWSRNANIYEVNIRQFTQEGTLKAFVGHLPRLKKMGVDILWLMPIQPIGKVERKGSLGSYYSISDYTAVHPEFGTVADMRVLVQEAHKLGMKVILDWVANHTAWDHPWAKDHKDWYKLNAKGELFPVTFTNGPEPEYWTDVIALNYDNKALWDGMIEAMQFWVRETNLDGFRCDVAGLVPTPFWERARKELDATKPMFMLSEWAETDLHRSAFDMTYDWDLHDVMKNLAKGKTDAKALRSWLESPKKVFPHHAYRMLFTNNHDKNSWDGTDAELFGPAYEAFAVLTFTLPGMPLIYGGQEARLMKRLAFFEKDAIDWKTYELQDFYTEMLALKRHNPALANGQYGGRTQAINTGNDKVFAFRRSQGSNTVTVAVNVSSTEQSFSMTDEKGVRTVLSLPAWRWKISTQP
ncbi:MAG: alpha-amylase [Burkholderiales bacterium PBB4]|nr:MAG: alpha-amylase [Burkholderiales bacterium PBB4]